MLERHGHGGDLHTAAELYGRNSEELLDYSSNMNPLGPPAAFKPIIERYWESISAYPDPIQRDLLQKIATRHNLSQEQVLAGNGAAELIELVVRYLTLKKAAILVPSFIEYEQAIVKAGASCIDIQTSPEEGFSVALEQLQSVMELEQPQLVMLGHPNNPTGTLLSRELLEYVLQCGAYVVIDEAFLDFHSDEEQLTVINDFLHGRDQAQYERLFVIRSMTKFYSIPGIRLGYIIAAEKHIAALKNLQVPWSVNSLAQQLGISGLEQEEFAVATKRWLAEELPWFTSMLAEMGLQPFPTVTNYMLVRIPESFATTSERLQQLMGKEGILIRDGGRFRGLDHSYIRLAIKDRASNVRMLQVLKRLLYDSIQHCEGGQV